MLNINENQTGEYHQTSHFKTIDDVDPQAYERALFDEVLCH